MHQKPRIVEIDRLDQADGVFAVVPEALDRAKRGTELEPGFGGVAEQIIDRHLVGKSSAKRLDVDAFGAQSIAAMIDPSVRVLAERFVLRAARSNLEVPFVAVNVEPNLERVRGVEHQRTPEMH